MGSARADRSLPRRGIRRCRIPENSANVSGLIFTSGWSITSRSSPANTATCIHFHGAPRNEPRAFSRLYTSSPLLSSRKWRKRQAVKFSPASPYRRRPIFRVYSRGDVVPAIHQLETRACATTFMYKSRVATFRAELRSRLRWRRMRRDVGTREKFWRKFQIRSIKNWFVVACRWSFFLFFFYMFRSFSNPKVSKFYFDYVYSSSFLLLLLLLIWTLSGLND